MKKAVFALLGVFVVPFFVGSVANACYADCIGGLCKDGELFYDGNLPFVTLHGGESQTWNYDFSYIGSEDVIQKAYLGIGILDWDRSPEWAQVSINGTPLWNSEVDTTLLPYSFDVASILDTNKLLSVTIGATCGDFKVTLVGVAGCYENNPVPEPASMLLLGTGLMGLVGMRRKLAKK